MIVAVILSIVAIGLLVSAANVYRETRHEQAMWADLMDRLRRGEFDTDGN